ncbi:MAG TPA: hypothetical protein VGH98_21070 [Gemmatimonadaceae bacterium]|jgi:hypothetical protein
MTPKPVILSAAKNLLLLAAALVSACGGPPISKQKASGIVEASAAFKSPKLVYLPRVLAIPADGIVSSSATREGEALNIIQIASVDPVVAVLRARDRVTIEDFVSAVPGSDMLAPKPSADTTATDSTSDSTKTPRDSTRPRGDTTKARGDSVKHHVAKPQPRLDEPRSSPPPEPPLAQAWVHTLRVTPRPQLQTDELAPDDGDDNPESPRAAYNARPIGRTPGWSLAVGSRDMIRILEVAAYTPTRSDPAGEARVDFLWRWRPTKPGAPFDTESAEYQSLPGEVQQAAIDGAVTVDTSNPHWSRAYLARDGAKWKVTSVDWNYGADKPHDRW